MRKLDKSKVQWIINEKQKGNSNRIIAETVGISTRWVKKLWSILTIKSKLGVRSYAAST